MKRTRVPHVLHVLGCVKGCVREFGRSSMNYEVRGLSGDDIISMEIGSIPCAVVLLALSVL